MPRPPPPPPRPPLKPPLRLQLGFKRAWVGGAAPNYDGSSPGAEQNEAKRPGMMQSPVCRHAIARIGKWKILVIRIRLKSERP